MENIDKNGNASEKEGDYVAGVVVEALPNTQFKVAVDDKLILTYLAGKMRLHRIKVLVGDKVEVLLDPYGTKGRIVKRL